jgi:hypothetical protein
VIQTLFALVATGMVSAGSPSNGAQPDSATGITIKGRVLSEPGGKALAGVAVTLWNGSGAGRWPSRTDETGTYSFSDVKPGDHYKLWIEECPGRKSGIWSEAVPVRVASLPVKADELFATLPQSLSGTVTDADTGRPVSGAVINFSTADRNRDSVRTDAEGRYLLFVSPREVDLYCTGTPDRYEPLVDPFMAERRPPVAVGAGKHVKNIDFKVKSAPPFTGLVVHPDGTPARRARGLVTVRRPPLAVGGFGDFDAIREYPFTTDGEGRFTGWMLGMRKSVAGDLTAENRNSAPIELEVVARSIDHSHGGIVKAKTTAKADFRLEPLKVVMARSASILVRAIDPDGKPIQLAEAGASKHAWRDWHSLGGPVKHIGDGTYLFMGLIPGLEYRVWLNAPGHRAAMYPDAITLKPEETRELKELRMEWWGKKAVPDLLKNLRSPNASDRQSATGLLGALGADAEEAVPELVKALKNDPVNSVRFSAAGALGRIGPKARGAVPDLITALQKDAGGGVQREAAIALGLIGDPSALEALQSVTLHVDTDIRRAAIEAVKRVKDAVKKWPVSQ